MGTTAAHPATGAPHLCWWERRWAVAAFVLISAMPLLWPDLPPLVDLPGHMGRYRVQLDGESSETLRNFYVFEWRLIGNLGIDLLVVPLSKVFGLELAVKLIVLAIPPLTVAGFLWVTREVHGKVPPTALFAVPLAYNFPFLFGFVNYALSMALAFLAFALWLRLGRTGRTGLRATLFVPIGILLWVCHVFGWAALGLLAFSAEWVPQIDRGRRFFAAGFHAGLQCLPLAPPVLLMLLWRSGDVGGTTGDWFNLRAKLGWFAMILRDRWMLLDVGTLILLCLLVFAAIRTPALRFSRHLAASAVMLTAAFLLLPRILIGSAYADMRLAPYALAAALLAIRMGPDASRRTASLLAMAGVALILVRTAATTASMALYDRRWSRELRAIEALPAGARVIAFVGRDCGDPWAWSRLDHLPALAIVRRHAFANDQWQMAGAQLLRVQHPAGGDFVADPSQFVVPNECRARGRRRIDDALRGFPRGAFDYLWLIRPPAHDPALTAGLRRVWSGEGASALYRIAPAKDGQ